VRKEHFNFYSSHFFNRALVLLLKSGFLVLSLLTNQQSALFSRHILVPA